MPSDIIVGLISGFAGVIIATIAARSQRPSPSRSLADASGLVIGHLRDEIGRLDQELDDERRAADGLRQEVERHGRRIYALEKALTAVGVDPASIN